jgi:hypothetical protein
MQQIRQCNSETKLKTIYLAQAALWEINNLQSRCHYPHKFQDDIAHVIQSIENKITDYRSTLTNLCSRLQSVNNLAELHIISTEYAKLDVVFQDSADYGDYQQLQAQIDSLKNNLEQVASINPQLIEEQDKDIINQILLLFQQLTPLEQQNLYARLGQILSEQANE